MLYRIVFVLLCIPALIAVFGLFHFGRLQATIDSPMAEFQVIGAENEGVTFVEFMNYGCGYCKNVHPEIKQLLRIKPDIRYVVRPLAFGPEETVRLNNLVIAAGLQGRFEEMHDAILSYPEIDVPDSFIRETANLYGLDVEQLFTDAQGEEVAEINEDNLAAFDIAGLDSVPSFFTQNRLYIVTDEQAPGLQDLLTMTGNSP